MNGNYRNAPDYYKVLEVEPTASQDEIKSAYRTLAKKWHPDRHKENKEQAEEKFKAIGEAYSVLSDENKKRQFDSRHVANFYGGFGSGFSSGFHSSNWPDDIENFIRVNRPKPRGRDIRGTMVISLKEAVLGCSRTIAVPKPQACSPCSGSGAKDNQFNTCSSCGGTGKQVVQLGHGSSHFVRTSACYRCAGGGKIPKQKCPTCSGAGSVVVEIKLEVDIPAGISIGSVLCARGQGEEGPGGAGDVYIVVNIEQDERFTRDGDDLLTTIEIPIAKAIVGGEVNFKWIDDTNLSIMIPPNCPNGQTFRISGKGAANGAPLIVNTNYNLPIMSAEDAAKVASVFSKYN